ncbi:CocE/NonD family hydrolase [uncultured Nocardioides sp.]|uniref:CocE/NonD family hydrolase n=1 Tax=uncultured Nocardioides sp. TaxID=198441 RepID=UPI00261012C6|nr:CocE/NonD family hydrolase [uncultured Nocardioides sp.]MCK5928455.1 CocE/NonD family hydrolase [Nocardioides sp.]
MPARSPLTRTRRALGGLLTLALVATPVTAAATGAARSSSTAAATSASPAIVDLAAQATRKAATKDRRANGRKAWTPRPEQYDGTAFSPDLEIPMSDGTILRGDLTRPAVMLPDGSIRAVDKRLPVVVTITAYNKSALASTGLGGSTGDYLVKRGYAQLTVDARGTGSSNGQWNAFDTRENTDAGEIMEWAASQEWSNGRTAMTGPSYMGISQLWAAAARPKGLKAIFPQVPGADVYRDVVASGGAIDVGFIPLWLGLVTATGLIPPQTNGSTALSIYLDHIMGAFGFTAQVIPAALLAQEPAYDGEFYEQRSVINVIDQVEVPAFFVSGEYDLFQRGTPLLFEALQRNGVPTKLITGPWDHLEGSSAADIGDAGYGTLEELQLRWFDHYVKGKRDKRLHKDIADLTYYEQGSGRWTRSKRWIDRDLRARSYHLSGSSTTALVNGSLTTGTPEAGTADVLPVPVSGACTRSANQWTAGILNAGASQFPFPNPCFDDSRINDLTGVVFETEPMERATAFRGPINARLYTSVAGAGDGMLSVSVEDVAPDGTVSRLTGGWQVLSLAETDRRRSRKLNGKIIQPWHPFTEESQAPLEGIEPVDVEVFPTAAKIRKGHRLRVAVQAFDVPHLLPTLPVLLGSLSVITVHTGPETPSELTVPWVRKKRR